MANEWDRQQTKKRGGGVHILSIDFGQAENSYGLQPVETETPEQLYDRRWALSQLDRVLERLEGEMEGRGKTGRFEVMKGLLTGDANRGFYATAASELNTSEGALRVAAHRMRRRFGELLRLEIADTVAEKGKIEEEMRHLFSALTG
jgi:RNA polymerase sigma-70 factor (ECF subfamily)